jgi:hypothetical protein
MTKSETNPAFLTDELREMVDGHPRPCDCGMQTGETCHCPPDTLSVPAAIEEVQAEGLRVMRELRQGGTDVDGPEVQAIRARHARETAEAKVLAAACLRGGARFETSTCEPAEQWARRTLSVAERNELAEEGATILAAGYGVDSRAVPFEMQGCSDVKEQSGARRVDPNSPALCGLTEAQRGPILRLIEAACRRAVAEDRVARDKDKQPGTVEPLFTPEDIEALAGIARRTDEARRMDLEARTKRLDGLPDGRYPESVLKVDLVSVFVEDGMPTVLLVPAGGKQLKARLAPALLGSLLAGLGLIVGSLVPPRR